MTADAPPPSILHLHYGRDGGAERFFVRLAHAFARRGVAQRAIIRPKRLWKAELPEGMPVMEGVWRRRAIGRPVHEVRRALFVRDAPPSVVFSWLTRGARSMPAWPRALKVARMGDYPAHLGYFRNVDVIVCNTPDITRHVRALGWTKPCETISNFADPPRAGEALSRQDLGIAPDAFTVVAAGRFVKRKGFHVLVEALKGTRAALVLIGDGEEREALARQARAAGIESQVKFVGWQEQPSRFYGAADILALPSLHEPLGNVILEGWQAGLPVVAADCEGPSWMIAEGEDGLLVPAGEADPLRAAIVRLEADPTLRRRLAEGARRTLDARFSESAVAEAYLALFAAHRRS